MYAKEKANVTYEQSSPKNKRYVKCSCPWERFKRWKFELQKPQDQGSISFTSLDKPPSEVLVEINSGR